LILALATGKALFLETNSHPMERILNLRRGTEEQLVIIRLGTVKERWSHPIDVPYYTVESSIYPIHFYSLAIAGVDRCQAAELVATYCFHLISDSEIYVLDKKLLSPESLRTDLQEHILRTSGAPEVTGPAIEAAPLHHEIHLLDVPKSIFISGVIKEPWPGIDRSNLAVRLFFVPDPVLPCTIRGENDEEIADQLIKYLVTMLEMGSVDVRVSALEQKLAEKVTWFRSARKAG